MLQTLSFADSAGIQTVTLTGTGIDFMISGPAAPVVVKPVQLAVFNITITPGLGGFQGPITLCAKPVAPAVCFPNGVAVEFPQPNQTPNGNALNVTMWAFTTGPGGATPSAAPPITWNRPSPPMLRLSALSGLLAVALFFLWLTQRKQNRAVQRLGMLLPSLALVLAMMSFTGCGGGATSAQALVTPAGTTQILVTATSGNLVRTTTVTLQVQ